MRLIPGKIKVKIELFKGISVVDLIIGFSAAGLFALVIVSSLPGKVFFCAAVALVAIVLLVRLDAEPNYLYLLHILCHFASRKRFERTETDRHILLRNLENGNATEFKEFFTSSEEEKDAPKESKKERKARIKAENKILKSKTASNEEKNDILERRKLESDAAARKAAEERDANLNRRPMQQITAFTDIRDGYIEYGGKYYGVAIEIPPIEFRFFSSYRRANSIESGFGRILRILPPEYSANLVKIERPMLYDDYLYLEYSKLDDLRASYEQNMIQEDEMKARVEIIYDRINELRDMCYGDKVVEAFYYLVLFDGDKRQLDVLVNTALDSLRSGELNPKRLNTKELAIFLKYTNQIDFDERDIDRISPDDYALWAMPQTVDLKPYTVEINHIITHNMRFVNYPTTVSDAWLAGVASMPGTKVVVKFHPMDRSKAVRGIDRSLQELRDQWDATHIDSRRMELEEHVATLSALLNTLQSDNETLLETSIYITSFDIAATRARTTAVQPPKSCLSVVTNMKKAVRRLYLESGFRLNNMDFSQFPAYVGSQVSGYDPMLSDSRGIPSNTLAASFPWIYASVADPKGVKIGVSDGIPVFVDFFRRDSERVNSNMVIVGKSGSGKSYATKSLLANLAADGAKIFILDPENEYSELATNLHGKFINVGNAQFGRLNPFHIITALDDDEESGETVSGSYATHLQFLEEFFTQIMPDCEKDAREYLNSIVDRMYTNMGITAETDLSTLRPEDYPIFDDLYDAILTEFQSTNNDYIRTMLRTLMNYVAKFSSGGRNANIWNGPSTVTTDENFTVFNFQSLLANRNSTIANSQMLLVLKYIDNEIIKNRDYNTRYHMNRKIVVAIDEAHVFIDTKYPIALDFMFQLAKRIRKYNGMQIVITQNIKDFVGSEEIARKSTAIINACQYSFIFALSPNDMDDLCTLYEKAGGINEHEQDQIVRAGRGQAFTVLSPQSRSSFKIVVPSEIQQMFKEPNYESQYFIGEEGEENWEDFIGDSREKRAAFVPEPVPGEPEDEDALQRSSKRVSFEEIGGEAAERIRAKFEEGFVKKPKEKPKEKSASSAEEDEKDAQKALVRKAILAPNRLVPIYTTPEKALTTQQLRPANSSRMEEMLGDLLGKLTDASVRQSVRTELQQEMASGALVRVKRRQSELALAEEEEDETEDAEEQQSLGSIFANGSEPEEEVQEEYEDQEILSVNKILEEYLRKQSEDKPSVIDLMYKYHDTVVNISLEELAYHNQKQEAAG